MLARRAVTLGAGAMVLAAAGPAPIRPGVGDVLLVIDVQNCFVPAAAWR